MKVELEKLTIGVSPITESVFIGTPNKAGNKWLNKKDITNEFIAAIINKYEGLRTEIESDEGRRFEIIVKELKIKR